MLSKAIELAAVLTMALTMALGASAVPDGPEDATHSVAQGEGPGHAGP